MVSVEKWKSHFKRFAHKAYPNEDMYIVAQSGRGLGRNAYKRTLYQIRTPIGNTNAKPTIEIVSPVASNLERAKALTKTKKNIKRKAKTQGATPPKKRRKVKKAKKKTAKPKRKLTPKKATPKRKLKAKRKTKKKKK